LLTREQIDALDDVESLVALQDLVTAAAKAIEVDLEYRSDDAADEFWEHRARRALTAHYVCNGHLTRRIGYLRRGGKPVKQGGNEAKARKKEAEAARLLAAAENKRAKIVEEREKTFRQMVAYADRQNLLAAFHRAARQQLDPGAFGRLLQAARADLETQMLAERDRAQGMAAPSGGETGTGSTVGNSPVGVADAPNPKGSPHASTSAVGEGG
jgi:hypothetical protein